MQIQKSDFPYYTLVIFLFLGLKWAYTITNQNDLQFLVYPVKNAITIITGFSASFDSQTGYYFAQLNIIIGKSCSGYNFWLLCFLLLVHLNGKHIFNIKYRYLGIPITLIVAYLITLFVNTSRIFVSIIIQNKAMSFISNDMQHILHESIGIVTNLTFLIIIYYLVEKHIISFFITKKN